MKMFNNNNDLNTFLNYTDTKWLFYDPLGLLIKSSYCNKLIKSLM